VGSKTGEVKYPDARLVISEVELVSNRLEDAVDFSPVSHILPKPSKGCTVAEIAVSSRDEEDKLQRLSREPSENLQYLSDPTQVAARALAPQEGTPDEAVASKLHPSGEGVAVRDFTWTSPDGLRTYSVTVNRPYWLLPSTFSADTVIWVPKRVMKTTCSPRPTH
jgi:hypothetical protein